MEKKEKTPGDSLISILKNTDELVGSMKCEIKEVGKRIDGFGKGLSRFEKILYVLLAAIITLCITTVFVSIQLTNTVEEVGDTVNELGETVSDITETIEPGIESGAKIAEEIAELMGHINDGIEKIIEFFSFGWLY